MTTTRLSQREREREEAERPKERLAWNCVRRARANCWREKKKGGSQRAGQEGRGETGKAYQTGFQITEVIPSVIDSPIATYRISVGPSRQGNYKGGRRGDAGDGPMAERGESAKESGMPEAGKEAGKRKEETRRWRRQGRGGGGGRGEGIIGRFLSAAWSTDDCEINWLLSAVHCHTIVITSVYVNRRVKSEFNTIINRYVTALKCTPGFKYAFTGECG